MFWVLVNFWLIVTCELLVKHYRTSDDILILDRVNGAQLELTDT